MYVCIYVCMYVYIYIHNPSRRKARKPDSSLLPKPQTPTLKSVKPLQHRHRPTPS